MKKSEMITKLTRMYHIRHVMVEGGYITPQQFMAEVLEYTEQLGMLPPETRQEDPGLIRNEWVPEDEE